jgi:hypothetical protein
MSRLVEFDELSIDFYDQTDIMGTGDAPSSNFNMPGGGSIDNYGNAPTYSAAMTRSKSALIAQSTKALTEKTVNRLKALRGVRSKLWRVDANGERQYQFARLINVSVTRTTDEARNIINAIQSVSCSWVLDSDTWIGEFQGIWQLNAGYKINDELQINSGDVIELVTSPQVETITIMQDDLYSKKLVRGAYIIVTAPTGASFSSIVIANAAGATLTFSGTVAAGTKLIIDALTNTVTNDGADAYDDLAISYSANYPFSWFPLALGDNAITITHDGADTIRFDYTEEHV